MVPLETFFNRLSIIFVATAVATAIATDQPIFDVPTQQIGFA